MEGDSLSWDYLLVPVGLCVLGIYHIWLLITVQRNPTKTVMGLNSAVRKQWVFSMMDVSPPFSFLLCFPSAIYRLSFLETKTKKKKKVETLVSKTFEKDNGQWGRKTNCISFIYTMISVFVSTSSSSSCDSTVSQQLVYTIPLSSIKCFCILLCFLVGFLCNVQSTRYFAHASFLATLPTGKDKTDYIEYVSTTVNRGSYFWSLGLRAFYLSIPLFLWIFGAIPMFVCCCIMTIALIIQPPVLHNLFTANPSKRKGEPMMSNQLVNRRKFCSIIHNTVTIGNS